MLNSIVAPSGTAPPGQFRKGPRSTRCVCDAGEQFLTRGSVEFWIQLSTQCAGLHGKSATKPPHRGLVLNGAGSVGDARREEHYTCTQCRAAFARILAGPVELVWMLATLRPSELVSNESRSFHPQFLQPTLGPLEPSHLVGPHFQEPWLQNQEHVKDSAEHAVMHETAAEERHSTKAQQCRT